MHRHVSTTHAVMAPTLTAAEFQQQGTTAAQALSISKAVRALGYHTEAETLRDTAFELARITGVRFRYGAPRQRRNPANDNRRRQRRAA
ncbi:hypothetical protein [Brucella haematophila]|uniref:Uncharacterized protein n=1 Tax=Brucella haematophila TaxID=419474 RepID=A0ABX1DSC9_9HYPH|nr:hypothetical protein [Brucella haematophila]NKC04462.1 hypothetical protein [Brucella haematophila]TMU84713.1 hypothetical protein FGI60_25965 [Brucella haematophila]